MNKKERPFPKWMRVGNHPDGNNLKRFVVCFYNDVYWAVGLENDLTVLENAMIFPYTYAEDIDENAEKVERLCKELNELEIKVAEIKEQIKQLNNG